MEIERRIVERLDAAGLWHGRSVFAILTGRSFAAVELDNGLVGTAMDYAHFRYDGPAGEAVRIASSQAVNTLLRVDDHGDLRECGLVKCPAKEISPTEQAVKIALLSALSQPLFTPSALDAADIRHHMVAFEEHRASTPGPPLTEVTGDATTVGVVGFGGLMELFAAMPSVGEVLVCDLNHERRAEQIGGVLERLNARFGRPKVRFVGPDIRLLRDHAEVVQLTASSLCNGTMDDLLAELAGRRLVLVGPSGALVPSVWFDHGVSLVYTEVKDTRYTDAYRFDPHLYDWFVEYDNRVLLWRYEVDEGPSGAFTVLPRG